MTLPLQLTCITLRCNNCQHQQLATSIEVNALKYHPNCQKCGKPVEIIRPVVYNLEYGYKRFRYMIVEENGLTRAVPVAGEIEAANKPQHRQGALEQWVRDGRPERARL